MIRTYETTNRLGAIARRQNTSRARDLIFACFVALTAILGASTVGDAVHGASTHAVER
jgi:hypothetical protein